MTHPRRPARPICLPVQVTPMILDVRNADWPQLEPVKVRRPKLDQEDD